ncbi:Rrf2 family transcriptional regulator [Pigmentiphaga soli]|uniref:Rrf2 family transcriptional regulator n=1 Tax=Pigmentiphaga soli TaxID=1007095 RepID=A0ABP8H604_9BURK
MRLTTMTDYALRLLMYVARHPRRLCTIAEIAQAHGISEAHLMKVTHRLGQQGWLDTVRGKGGGMRLARAPAEIKLGDVVRGIEPDFDLVECFATGSQCTLTGDCRLAGVLGGALREFIAYLDGYTLADLLPGTDLAPTVRRVRLEPRQAGSPACRRRSP